MKIEELRALPFALCGDINIDIFWKKYNVDRENIKTIMDKQGVTFYTLLQIKVSIEKSP